MQIAKGLNMLLREVKGENEQNEHEEETSVNVGDKKITIKVQDNSESTNQPGKRQLLCE
jgi:hypothetical protein